MATMQTFTAGLDELHDWGGAGSYEWALVTAGTFDASHATVQDAVDGGVEPVGSRTAASTVLRTVDVGANRISYTADDPSWTGTGPGWPIVAVMLYRLITGDADSIPIAWWDISPSVASDAADPLVFTLDAGLVAYTDQAA